MPTEDKVSISPLPVTVGDLRKYPMPTMLFLCLIAISVLYVRSEKENRRMEDERKEAIRGCVDKTDRLSTEVSFLTERVRRSDSALADVRATLKVLKEVRQIK